MQSRRINRRVGQLVGFTPPEQVKKVERPEIIEARALDFFRAKRKVAELSWA